MSKPISLGLSHKQTAELCGCSKNNITERLAVVRDDIKDAEHYKKHRADTFAILQHQLLNTLSLEDIKKMPGIQRIIGAATLYDKETIEREKHETGNDIGDMHLSLEEIERKLEALESGAEPGDEAA